MAKGNKTTKQVKCSLCSAKYSVIIPVKGVTMKSLKCKECGRKGVLRLAQNKK
jgi:transcription elongation factor Elf1